MVEVIRRKRMEAEDRLLYSETQASVGRLAAEWRMRSIIP